MDYASLWFVFWAVLWTGYFALDGFDLGVGFSGWLAADGAAERRHVFSSIGPFWDGNEVWLITAGGATFAAFPPLYAGLFSWLYPALLLILFSLILRGAALEFRGKGQSPAWRQFWERVAAWASFCASLLFGVLFGNIFRGLEIGPDGYHGTFAGLFTPYALLTGLLFCVFFFLHGQLWLAYKTRGATAIRAAGLAGRAWWGLLVLLTLFMGASWRQTGLYANFIGTGFLVLPVLCAGALAAAKLLLGRAMPGRAFFASFCAIALFCLSGFVGIYPALLPSRLDPEFSLTIYNSASSVYTLKLMAAVVIVFLPVVIAYQIWVYRLFRSPFTENELENSGIY